MKGVLFLTNRKKSDKQRVEIEECNELFLPAYVKMLFTR